MQNKAKSERRVKIDKAKTITLVIIAITSFVTTFSIFASRALITQYFYESKVAKMQQVTINQLATDNESATSLIISYEKFVNQTTNIIGGSASGNGPQDGPNGRIILDALPDAYDFPALATSIQKILGNVGVSITSITGTDTSASLAPTTTSTSSSSTSSSPVTIPFAFSVQGSYILDQEVIQALQNSIRPIHILTIAFTGSDADLTMAVTAETYYQIAPGVTITTEAVQ